MTDDAAKVVEGAVSNASNGDILSDAAQEITAGEIAKSWGQAALSIFGGVFAIAWGVGKSMNTGELLRMKMNQKK